MSKLRIIILLFVLLLIANVSIFYINKINVEDRIQLVLDDNLVKLDIHYNSVLIHQTQIADSFYNIIVNKKDLLKLYSKALNSSNEERDILRKELIALVQFEYRIFT